MSQIKKLQESLDIVNAIGGKSTNTSPQLLNTLLLSQQIQ